MTNNYFLINKWVHYSEVVGRNKCPLHILDSLNNIKLCNDSLCDGQEYGSLEHSCHIYPKVVIVNKINILKIHHKTLNWGRWYLMKP